jgi:hypothetical protein
MKLSYSNSDKRIFGVTFSYYFLVLYFMHTLTHQVFQRATCILFSQHVLSGEQGMCESSQY